MKIAQKVSLLSISLLVVHALCGMKDDPCWQVKKRKVIVGNEIIDDELLPLELYIAISQRNNRYASPEEKEDSFSRIKELVPLVNLNEGSEGRLNRLTPLGLAVVYGDVDTTSLLLQNGADPNQGVALTDFTPLVKLVFELEDWKKDLGGGIHIYMA